MSVQWQDSELPLQGEWIQSVIGKLKSQEAGKGNKQTNQQKLCDLESIHPFAESLLICSVQSLSPV